MKFLLFLLFAVGASEATNLKYSRFATADGDFDVDQEWTEFKQTYRCIFHKLNHEEERKSIFEDNLKRIKNHNDKFAKNLVPYEMAVNQFSVMTSEEFRLVMLMSKMGDKPSKKGSTFLPPMNIDKLPEEVDWRKEGYVTPVKDQGYCGSCWAFSTVGSIEGQQYRKTKKLVSLSEQNLIDCSTRTWGCHGGWVYYAFDYLKNSSGIDTEDSYPYKAEEQECHFNEDTVGARIYDYVRVEANESALRQAVATVGPISIIIDADPESFVHYSKGVYYDHQCNPNKSNHAVLVVGYGKEDGQDYWLVKNSWGVKWGDLGYIKIARNRNNHCGVASNPSYPILL